MMKDLVLNVFLITLPGTVMESERGPPRPVSRGFWFLVTSCPKSIKHIGLFSLFVNFGWPITEWEHNYGHVLLLTVVFRCRASTMCFGACLMKFRVVWILAATLLIYFTGKERSLTIAPSCISNVTCSLGFETQFIQRSITHSPVSGNDMNTCRVHTVNVPSGAI